MITLVASAALLAPQFAHGQKANGLHDLIGARAPGGETALQSRGWVHIKTDPGDDRVWSYWWQPAQKNCVSIAVKEGRFDSITPTTAPDCNQKVGGKGPSGSAVAAGVGVAAIVGAIALAHKSYNHDNGQHYDDDASDAAYERGFRDGLYSQTIIIMIGPNPSRAAMRLASARRAGKPTIAMAIGPTATAIGSRSI